MPGSERAGRSPGAAVRRSAAAVRRSAADAARWLPAFLLAALTLAPSAPAGAQPSGRALTVYYSASLNGNLDGCICREAPRAGLVKRAVFLRGLEDRRDALLLDLGDLLDVYPDPDLARHILETCTELGYDAMAVGDQELANGVEALLEYGDRYPMLSNNLQLCPDETRCILVSPTPLLLERAGRRIGVFSVIDPQVFALYPAELRGRVKIQEPEPVVRACLGFLEEERANLRVLLYHGPWERALELVRRVPGIDLLLVGHEQRLVAPRREGRTIVASPGEEGNHLGVLTLTFSRRGLSNFTHRFHTFRYTADPDDPAVRRRIAAWREALRARLRSGGG